MAALSNPNIVSQDMVRKGFQQQAELASQIGDASCSCSEAEARREDGSDNDMEICDVVLDGAAEDEFLKGADALTEEEVVRRRARRVKQLMKLYRMQYWALIEELRSKYRMFYLRNGKGGWREEAEGEKERAEALETSEAGKDDRARSKMQDGVMKEPHAPEKSSIEISKCVFQGCKSKPLALSVFCFSHILSEPRQQLYKPCTYVTRSGQNGSFTCGKPVLRAVVPSFCPAHVQKQATRSMRKTNLGVSTAASKPAPKLHLVIAEYVRFIQNKRRSMGDATLKYASFSNKDGGNKSSSVIQQEQTLPSV